MFLFQMCGILGLENDIDLTKRGIGMQRPFISVIIPVYNVENYLAECLVSVIEQSLKEIEIICIEGGSSDNSLQILYSFF